MAELVQNSLDAGARHVTVTRQRRRGEVALSILDDGKGVFPDLAREEALERIATNVGHSFKLNLSPAQRQQEMTLGKYGIGILGFWSLGKELEMRSRVGGSEVWSLRLVRDEEDAEVLKLPQRRIAFPGETWTEVLIRGVDPGVARLVTARRLGDYLASELRGQLLDRKVKLRMVDKLAQNRAVKDFLVRPQRFHGRRIPGLDEIPVPGHSPARLEIYYVGEAGGERRGAVALTCGGTRVGDDLSAIEGGALDHAPWSLGALEGVVEFRDREVAPATRRGFTPGPAADALFAALAAVEPALNDFLARVREERQEEEEESLAREIRRVFRPLAKRLPQYDFFDIAGESREKLERPRSDGARLGRAGEGEE
ncbi:MAG: ATP-binding protein, partial [Thermoanaerobaculia bacterium]